MTEAEIKKITLEDLENYERFGMRCKETIKYQDVFKELYGRDLNPDEDMVKVGHYDSLIFDEEGNWTKFEFIGDDIGDGDMYLFLMKDGIYLDKTNIMLDEGYHDMFRELVQNFFENDVTFTIDFSGLNK